MGFPVSDQDSKRPDIRKIALAVFVSAVAIILPGKFWMYFGWMHMLLPLVAFYLLARFGEYTGKRVLVTACVLSVLGSALLGVLDSLLFAAVFLLSGYVLYRSFHNQDSPGLSGLKTSLALGCGWILILFGSSLGSDVSVYGQLIQILDQGISEALVFYRQNDSVSAETLVMLETTLQQMKTIVPMILPAILGSLMLFITWFTMVTGNSIMNRIRVASPWPSYSYWQLPDKLIWGVIAMAILALLPVYLPKLLAINSLIMLSMVYTFQGLSVVVFFMNKWNVPILLRSLFYVMVILQSFGTIILLFLGIADIWLDFRKLKLTTAENQ